MKKTLFTTILIILFSAISVYAQTLKVTSVNASDDKLYNRIAPRELGKELTLTIYDNSVLVKTTNGTLVLKMVSENKYSKTESSSEKETVSFELIVNKTMSVITSANFTKYIRENGGLNRSAWYELKATRF
ncbi:hypothetical protein [Solitalea lacus]|uniref:hypothetical protein n=1 Tax=Solitalea lacus TaxID=2911172 RepID=UPI001EDB9AAA|nr:hypothetical protein [Solitalea lacus]UKJ07788.1 hypothetical protein L2B55_01160 [Solitalea lacus]